MSELNWNELNKKSAQDLLDEGFGCWDGKLYLIPFKRIEEIPYGTKFTDIFYQPITYTKETDLDQRFGYVAFGVVPYDKTHLENPKGMICQKN